MIVKGVSSSQFASGQVWGLALLSKERRLITGSADSELRVWDLTYILEVRHSLCNPSAPLPSCLSLNWDGTGTCSNLMDVLGNSQSLCCMRGLEAAHGIDFAVSCVLSFQVTLQALSEWDFQCQIFLPSDVQLRKTVLCVDDNHGSTWSAWCFQECCRTLQCMLTSCISREMKCEPETTVL